MKKAKKIIKKKAKKKNKRKIPKKYKIGGGSQRGIAVIYLQASVYASIVTYLVLSLKNVNKNKKTVGKTTKNNHCVCKKNFIHTKKDPSAHTIFRTTLVSGLYSVMRSCIMRQYIVVFAGTLSRN